MLILSDTDVAIVEPKFLILLYHFVSVYNAALYLNVYFFRKWKCILFT